MKKYNFNSNAFIIVSLIIFISSCGYHLRGDIALPDYLQHVYIQDKGGHEISQRLKQRLLENKIVVVDSPDNSQSIITVYSSKTERRAIAVRAKEVKEYELRLVSSFSVHKPDGTQRGKTQTVSAIRRYSFNNDQVLGAGNEEQILINEMRDDIVMQVLRRLIKLVPQH